MKRHITLSACGLVVACVTYVPPQVKEPEPLPATPVRASFDRTWATVIDFFADQAIPVKTLDRSSGYIAAERLGAGNNLDWADCGKIVNAPARDGGGRVIPQQAVFNVRVRGDSASSTVQVVARWMAVGTAQVASGFGSRTKAYNETECVTTHVWETAAIREITRRAEGR